ncbi:MAG: recombination protein RecR [Chloroflexi bacterium]|nr:recombination protein RecR [Chloroflexota bacterium]
MKDPIERLIEAFSRLPGIGPKTAARLTYFLLRAPDDVTLELAEALRSLKEEVHYCRRCFNVAQGELCTICADPSRDPHTVCVVEEPLDVVALERSGAYRGLYHVLHGAINPLANVGPEDLRINELVERVQKEPIQEVILATNPNMEGEATAMYIARLLRPLGVRITRLAHGLPIGGDLEYADQQTLAQALEGRRPVEP